MMACLCQIRSGMLPINSIHVLLHRHLSVVASSMFLDKACWKMMDSYENT